MPQPRPRPLSLKERRFIDAYLGSCNGNAAAALREAGYGASTARSQSAMAARLIAKGSIRAAIEARQQKRTKQAILTADQRDQHLSMLAKHPLVQPGVQVQAIKELNKVSGRHSIHINLDASERLSEIIAASRAPLPDGEIL